MFRDHLGNHPDRIGLAAVALLLIHLCLVSPLPAAEFESLLRDDPDTPWNIVADQITYDNRREVYMARGNVVISKQDRRISADFIQFDHQNLTAVASGNVLMVAGEDVLTGHQLEIDLQTETGTLHQGTLFLSENHFYIRGNKIQKIGPETYTAENVRITSCDGERPAWRLTGRNLRITIEGYGVVRHAALKVRDIPVVYTPWMRFPVKFKRQSGLLPPRLGFSDRKGAEYQQPVYWAINSSSDATVYGHLMEKRGVKVGLEYRYVFDHDAKGTLMADFLNDRKVDDGLGNSSQTYGYDQDAFLRPNEDRYWLRSKHDQQLPHQLRLNLDLDIVSDQDYLQEFKSGYNGFDDTENYFRNTFGRGIDDFNDPIRFNQLNLSRNWDTFSLNAGGQWFDNVINRRQAATDPTLQRLPFARFEGARQPLWHTPLYFDLTSEYNHFYREDGTRGHRADLWTRLYYPYHINGVFMVEPSVGVRETIWHIDTFDTVPAQDDRTRSRELYDLQLDIFTELKRTFATRHPHLQGIQHTLKPQLLYRFVPQEDQSDLPFFDATDRIAKEHRITYALTNLLVSKWAREIRPQEDSAQSVTADAVTPNYNTFCRFKLSQSFDINEAREDNPLNFQNQSSRRPFSPIAAELELTPIQYLLMDADAAWSPYDNEFVEHNTALTLNDTRGNRFMAEYRYTKDVNQSVLAHLTVVLDERIELFSTYERNLRDKKTLETGGGLRYKAQCWSTTISYTEEEGDQKVEISLNLFGLGSSGN
jgi:LPS-assembly protein